MDSRLALIEEIANYVHDPLGFCRVMFPWGEGELAGISGPRVWQAEELAAIGAHLQNASTRFTPYLSAVVSGNGPGQVCSCRHDCEMGHEHLPRLQRDDHREHRRAVEHQNSTRSGEVVSAR